MNFKHLYYFWKVASCGGVIRAAEQLHTTPQTLSGQIKLLEERLGTPLFRKQGRKLVLTEAGVLASEYAEEIFSLGAELQDLLAGDETGGLGAKFRVGVADALPNTIVRRLLEPVFRLEPPVSVVCHEWRIDRLLSELAIHKLDLVISDAPIPPGFSVKAWSHRLGASKMAFFAVPRIAEALRAKPFPRNLHAQPMLLLGADSGVRGQFDRWIRSQNIRPRVLAEFDDSGLIKAFGRAGLGIFMAPQVLATETCRDYGVELVGVSEGIEQVYYAISVQRRITHPCAEAIVRAAHQGL